MRGLRSILPLGSTKTVTRGLPITPNPYPTLSLVRVHMATLGYWCTIGMSSRFCQNQAKRTYGASGIWAPTCTNSTTSRLLGMPSRPLFDELEKADLNLLYGQLADVEDKLRPILRFLATKDYSVADDRAPEEFWWRHWKPEADRQRQQRSRPPRGK